MGYRSEVAVRIEVPTSTTAKELIERIEKDYVKLNDLFDDVVVDKEFNFEVIKLHTDYVKWYDTFDDVYAFHRFLDDFGDECEEEKGAYHFIRIGEDLSDIDERCVGDLYSYMSMTRFVDWK